MKTKSMLQTLCVLMLTWSLFAGAEQQPKPDLLGVVSADAILALHEFQREYERSHSATYANPAFDREINLVVLFGSWCHDSQREVPRLMKTLEANNIVNVQYVAISRDKKAPDDIVATYKLAYTPTVIVLRQGVELGRIVEQPQGDWMTHLRTLIQTPLRDSIISLNP